MPARTQIKQQLAATPLDLLIIGGGIVGAGIARDAAMRGLRTGLVEQYDFAFGTSSRSSRLLHGGLRYLAQGHIGLVREASREKHVLQKIAPHLTQPLAFVFPTYRGTLWPRWKLGIGVKIYDWLCGHGNLGKSSTLSIKQTLDILGRGQAALETSGLTGAVRYYDALTQDARLVLDTLRSASRHGALVCNYMRMNEASKIGETWHCRCSTSTDATAESGFDIQARCVVSAAGPWAGKLPRNTLGLRLTKGVHVVIERQRLPVPDAVVLAEGSRILFAIPWGERVILGTTDTDYKDTAEKALAEVQAEAQDIAYILAVVNKTFPQARLCEQDVRSTWAGLRPLIANPKNGAPSDISRSHEIIMSEPGWLEAAGGKLTTYRLMAEQSVDMIERYLLARTSACHTAAEPLLAKEELDVFSSIVPPAVTRAAVEHYCRNEWAVKLNDIMLRRGGWLHYVPDQQAVARQVAEWMAEILGWDERRLQDEIISCIGLGCITGLATATRP